MHCRLGKRRAVTCLLLCIMVAAVFFMLPWESHVCACGKCLTEGDPWFRELITAAPNPFLSKKDKSSEAAFNWWKGLQRGKANFSVYNETLHSIFQIIPPFPQVVGPSPYHCRSCAVVGNSGILNGSHYGPQIDCHNIVIRMNRGRTKGFEADVGTKTTHHIMYPESAIKLDATTQLVFCPFKTKDLLWLLKKLSLQKNSAVSSARIANKDLVKILNPAFMKYVHEVWLEHKGRYPSTGFLALALSMHICDEINVFGFGADRDGNWNHYFEKLRNKKLRTGPHAGTHEYKVIQELHKKQKIQFFNPLVPDVANP